MYITVIHRLVIDYDPSQFVVLVSLFNDTVAILQDLLAVLLVFFLSSQINKINYTLPYMART